MKRPTTFLLLRILYLVCTLATVQAEGSTTIKISNGNTTHEKIYNLKCENRSSIEPKENSTYKDLYDEQRENKVGNFSSATGVLIIEKNHTLYGNYECENHNITDVVMKWYLVKESKEKDPLAALWPFLGICAEVIVLCAIILIYEKKRNKAELDESDTDQSPDTKPTPNKDSDVRQRN